MVPPQLLKQLFLFFSKVYRQLNIIGNIQVPKLIFLFINGQAFAFQLYFGSVLGFGLYFYFYFTVQGINSYLAPKYSSIKIKLCVGVKVAAVPFKARVGGY